MLSGRSQGVKNKTEQNKKNKNKEKRKGTVMLKEGATQQERQKGNERVEKQQRHGGKQQTRRQRYCQIK